VVLQRVHLDQQSYSMPDTVSTGMQGQIKVGAIDAAALGPFMK